MFELADGVYQLSGKPPNTINIYLIDGILVDAGTPQAHRRIFRELGDRVPTAHLVTHAHPDHYGSSHAVCEKYGIPLLTGANDADAIEKSGPEANDTFIARNILSKMPPPPAHPVDTRLNEGDKVGSFEVLDTPGHSRGHIVLWRAGDKTGPGRCPVQPEPVVDEDRSARAAPGADPRPGAEPGLRPQGSGT